MFLLITPRHGPHRKHLSLSLILRLTVSRPVCLRIKHPSGTYDQIFITVRRVRVCWYGALSLTRERVCSLQLLQPSPAQSFFGSVSHGARDHILLSQIRDFRFRRLLQLARLRWRYSTRLHTGEKTSFPTALLLLLHVAFTLPRREHRFPVCLLMRVRNL
jgi:hypothetical protein